MPIGNPLGYLTTAGASVDPFEAQLRQRNARLSGLGEGLGQEGQAPAELPQLPADPLQARLAALATANQERRGETPRAPVADVDELNLLGRLLQGLGVL